MATDEFLEAKAAEMRLNPTKAERYLRSQLTTGCGWSFQVPILGAYIADFLHDELGLVVEADGGYHDADLQRLKDTNRDRVMCSKGFQVLRFTNRDIYQRQAWVMDCIHRRLNVIRRLKGLPIVEIRKPKVVAKHKTASTWGKNPLGLGDYRKRRYDLDERPW